MGAVAITLLVFFIAVAYTCIGTFSGVAHDRRSRAVCSGNPNDKRCTSGYSWHPHVVVSLWLAGIGWPIGWPVIAAMGAGNRVGGPTRSERKKEKELNDARHRVEVAKLLQQENAILDRQLQENRRRR